MQKTNPWHCEQSDWLVVIVSGLLIKLLFEKYKILLPLLFFFYHSWGRFFLAFSLSLIILSYHDKSKETEPLPITVSELLPKRWCPIFQLIFRMDGGGHHWCPSEFPAVLNMVINIVAPFERVSLLIIWLVSLPTHSHSLKLSIKKHHFIFF